MKKILFQGDSITDCGRAREGGYAHWLGNALIKELWIKQFVEII